MLHSLPPELISSIGEYIDSDEDFKSCLMTCKAFTPIMYNRVKSRTLSCSHQSILTHDKVRSIQKLQPNIQKYVFNIDVKDMTNDEIEHLSSIVNQVCAAETVKNVNIYFTSTIDFTKFFLDNQYTEKCNIMFYCLGNHDGTISFPCDKQFCSIYMCMCMSWYATCKHIMPLCKLIVFTKQSRTYTTNVVSFEHIDPKKTKVYVDTADMNLLIRGTECVRYFMCHDMIMYGAVGCEIIEHYAHNPLQNLEDCVLGSRDVNMSSKLDTFYLYKIMPYIKSNRYVFLCTIDPFMIPFIRYIATHFGIRYDQIGLVCSSVLNCIVGRCVQLLVSNDVQLITCQEAFISGMSTPVSLNFVNWLEMHLFDDERKVIEKMTNIRELLEKSNNDNFKFLWSVVLDALQYDENMKENLSRCEF